MPGSLLRHEPRHALLVQGAIVAVALAFVTGLLPALRAKRLNIIDALAGR